MQGTRAAEGVAIAAGTFLSGAMMSISLLAVPTCLDTALSAAQLCRMWERVFHYGHRKLPALALATGVLYISIGLRERSKRWPMVIAGLATVSIMPFTWAFMFPTNDRLFAMVAAVEEDVNLAEARSLVIRWCRLHLTRSMFPLMGSIVGLMAAV